MFHDIIRVYADAMYVATTLRLPPSAWPARESECLVDCELRSRRQSLSRLVGRIADRLRTRLGRGGATAAPAEPIRPSFIRAPYS